MTLLGARVRLQSSTPSTRRGNENWSERILTALAAARSADGSIAVPISTLAAELDTSERQIKRSTAELVRESVLVVVHPAQTGGRYAPKVYRLARDRTHLIGQSPGVLSAHRPETVTPRLVGGI